MLVLFISNAPLTIKADWRAGHEQAKAKAKKDYDVLQTQKTQWKKGHEQAKTKAQNQQNSSEKKTK
jgi:hypothetical protein